VPFTGSHVAAVLPLGRTRLATSALVIGSMAPDLPYYVPLRVGSERTHALAGVVGVDVLLGLAVLVLWHGLLVAPVLATAPPALRRRVPASALAGLRFRLGSVRALGLLWVSLAVGALTHVVWDAFTHQGRWGSQHIAWLAERHGSLTGCRWAQYVSGVVGALVLAAWLVRWSRSDPVRPAGPGVRRSVALAAWAATALVGAVAATRAVSGPRPGDLHTEGYLIATRGISAAALTALGLAALWHLRAARSPAPRPG
jgi:hypothetical protein